ncbi:MAG TPA: acyl-CoA dehydrogenase family protein [Iamia sp.]
MVRPPGGEAVGSPIDDLRGIEALALATLAADALGVAGRALDLAVAHARQREQFGRPIGSFQAVQHLLADAAVLVEGMRSCTWHAAWAASALEPAGALLAARQAKAWCGRGARRVVEIAVQCLGGIAITHEHPAHLLLRRALLDDALFGTAATHLTELAIRFPEGQGNLIASSGGGGGGLDYADSVEEADLRRRLRGWLETVEHDGDGDDPEVRHRWHRVLAEAGWVGLSLQGGTVVDEAIVNEELARAGAPPAPPIGHLAHAIRLYGRDDQRRALLPPLLAGTERWCQGFSEPGAGSDLAAIATRAELGDDGRYRVTGQKVWTSEAVWADHCLLLARTEPDEPAHRGLSMLVVPMRAPGVDVRPITTAYGTHEFAEVFLDDVVVPADDLLGRPGQGWEIAMALLGFERGPSDIGWTARLGRRLADLEASVRDGRREATPVQRQALAEAWCDLETLRLHVLRTTHARRDGRAPGPEGSIDKLLMIEADQRLGHVVLDLLGAEAVLDESAAFPGYVWSRAQSIFGGTQQVQRTIVATRLLGLPRS